MNRIGPTLLISIGLVAACGGLDEPPVDPNETDPNSSGTSGGEDNTFDHDNFNPFGLIEQLQEVGPPRFSSRVHSCPKIRYETLGNVLASLGVNMANQTQLSAGQLFATGENALGAPNYGARIRENLGITTSGASREFDIFAAAADEIMTALPTLPRCQVNGTGVQLFDASNNCLAAGITCLIGVPATADHINFCNTTVQRATDPNVGRRIAVAAMLAAAHTCE